MDGHSWEYRTEEFSYLQPAVIHTYRQYTPLRALEKSLQPLTDGHDGSRETWEGTRAVVCLDGSSLLVYSLSQPLVTKESSSILQMWPIIISNDLKFEKQSSIDLKAFNF